ncbi:hypothetical protein V6N11_001579 [Hibiscus sabdariffa]|uniref:Uncharacterized protein n=1 Tax=Hibiscus sabdariffa TaxID=183260 RepID=A0ABR2S0N3_9ROSI
MMLRVKLMRWLMACLRRLQLLMLDPNLPSDFEGYSWLGVLLIFAVTIWKRLIHSDLHQTLSSLLFYPLRTEANNRMTTSFTGEVLHRRPSPAFAGLRHSSQRRVLRPQLSSTSFYHSSLPFLGLTSTEREPQMPKLGLNPRSFDIACSLLRPLECPDYGLCCSSSTGQAPDRWDLPPTTSFSGIGLVDNKRKRWV